MACGSNLHHHIHFMQEIMNYLQYFGLLVCIYISGFFQLKFCMKILSLNMPRFSYYLISQAQKTLVNSKYYEAPYWEIFSTLPSIPAFDFQLLTALKLC